MKDNNYTTEVSILVYIGAFFVISFILMLSWNYFMPLFFGLKTITFWQACIVRLLSGCIFRSVNTTSNK